MADRLTLSLESAFIVLKLGDKTFDLQCPRADMIYDPDTPDTRERAIRRYVNWRYHAPYHSAFDLGSLSSVTPLLQEIETALNNTGQPQAQSLVAQWENVKSQLNSVPTISNTIDTVLNTSVKITDLGLSFDIRADKPAAGTTARNWQGSGSFVLGLAFTPSPANPIQLFNLSIQAFGAALSVKLEGVKLNTQGQVIWGS